jgi:hypothetical protein
VIGVHHLWEFCPRWSLDAMFQFFALKFGQCDGNLQLYTATVFATATLRLTLSLAPTLST